MTGRRDSLLDTGRQVLAAQPFSVLLGAELLDLGNGRADLRIPLRPDLLQQSGFAHGGVISYAADNAMAFAAGTVLGSGVLNSEMKINYLKPAKGALVARASVIHAGRTQAVCRCDVFAAERLCATSQGTVAIRPDEALHG